MDWPSKATLTTQKVVTVPVGQLDVLVGGHAVGGARPPGRHVDLAAHGAALPEDLAFSSPRRNGWATAGGEVVVEAGRGGQDGHRTGSSSRSRLGRTSRWHEGSMSVMSPGGRPRRQLGRTRMPVAPRRGGRVDGVEHRGVGPVERISAQAKGVERVLAAAAGAPRPRCDLAPRADLDQLVSSSAVYGSYSAGGTRTRPPLPRCPDDLPSRNPVMNAPITGPTERGVRVLQDMVGPVDHRVFCHVTSLAR